VTGTSTGDPVPPVDQVAVARDQATQVVQGYDVQHEADVLLKAGLPEMADDALRELPDLVEREQVAAWAVPYGINLGELISRMSGSP
jgi:hypothetical protein